MSRSLGYCHTFCIVFIFAGLLQAQKDYEIGISSFVGDLKSGLVTNSIFANYPSFGDVEVGIFIKENNRGKLSPVIGANLLFRHAAFDCVHMAPNGVDPRSPGLRIADRDCNYSAKVNYWHLEIPASIFYKITDQERLNFYLILGWSPIITGRVKADLVPVSERGFTEFQIGAIWTQLIGGFGASMVISKSFNIYLEAGIKKQDFKGRWMSYGLRCRIAYVI